MSIYPNLLYKEILFIEEIWLIGDPHHDLIGDHFAPVHILRHVFRLAEALVTGGCYSLKVTDGAMAGIAPLVPGYALANDDSSVLLHLHHQGLDVLRPQVNDAAEGWLVVRLFVFPERFMP